jgi:hypothetical protein
MKNKLFEKPHERMHQPNSYVLYCCNKWGKLEFELKWRFTHVLCDCEAAAYLRFRHLGHCFMEPGDYQTAV